MIGHRARVALLVMTLAAAVVSGLPGTPLASAAAADPAPADSAVTVSGRGDFANLKVTVSQTKNLVNQIVKVSWTGGAPTDNTGFLINYLQIMQCWGDDLAGPDRSQCQFGGLTALGSATSTGTYVLSRQLNGVNDPAETLKEPSSPGGQVYVPFWVVGRDRPTGSGTGNTNDFFDSQVTNEIPMARTHGDGTGEEFFEIETVTQAAGLGCGEPVITGKSTTGRRCWLVVVPRGTKDADGNTYAAGNIRDALASSPLSQSNWDNRIMIPLEFQPVGQPCPLGASERPLIGHELVVGAVSSWQPALCAGGGALFSYTQLPDDVARSQVLDGKLALIDNPVSPEQAADHPLVYAPVGLSALTFAFNINYQPPDGAPPDIQQLKGRRFTSMKLTPRLVAKLLTQSYRYSLLVPIVELKNNPIGLLYDPEFLNFNPEYKGLVDVLAAVPDALVQINGADVTSQLWSWVISDPAARAFLTGAPDESGMVINPSNKNLSLPTSTFPRNDQGCVTNNDDIGNAITNCNLDFHPYANDMHDAGRSASRGDTLARENVFDRNIGQPVSKKKERQFAGKQGLIAVVDAATAARYGLPTAQLRNATRNFVAPTPESLLAGAAAMKASAVPEVLAPDLGASDPAAYPLTSLSYAVTAPARLDAAAGKDYAAFLRYAGGPGQQQGPNAGQLPPGMAPLPDRLKAQTLAAATTIARLTSPRQPAPGPSPTSTADPTRAPAIARTPGQPSAGRPPVATPAPLVPPLPTAAAIKAPSVAQQPVAQQRRTPTLPGPWWVGVALVVTLIVGAAAAMSSPAVQPLGTWLARRLRKGVTPIER